MSPPSSKSKIRSKPLGMNSNLYHFLKHNYPPIFRCFFDDTYVPAEVFIDFDKPPIFDDHVFEKILYKSNSHFVDCFYESHISLTTQSTSLTLRTMLDRNNTHMQLSFPTFGGDDSQGWIFKDTQYVDFKHIHSTKFGDPLNCGESNELELSAYLFGIYPCGQG